MNLYDFLLANVRSGDIAVIAGQEPVRYAALIEVAESIACTLRQVQVGKGDRVGIVADDSPFWISSYLGIMKIGSIAVPIPARLGGEGFRQLASVTGCHAFCADRKRLLKHGSELPPGSHVIVRHDVQEAPTPGSYRLVTLLRGSVPTAAVDDRTDLAALMFTSGSTGQPNAVRVSHRNIIANTTSIIEALGIERTDRIMVVLPFDYCFSTSLLHTHLRVGGTMVIHNAFQYTEDVLNVMAQHACTEIAGVPYVYQHLLRKSTLARRAWPHLRLAQQAGGKLPDAFIRDFVAAMPATKLFVMYGQTEATARLSYLPPERLTDKLGSIGRGLPGVDLRVLDPFGKGVAPGEVGEIVAEGENVALGYWLEDDARRSFRDDRLYTGDLARVDSDGFIYLVGRSGDFVKPMGHRISCQEIEEVLAGMPGIVEVAIRGVADPVLGEAVKAYITTASSQEISVAEIQRFCKGRLADYAVPRYLTLLPELPRNDANKVLKSLLPT